MSTSQPRNPQFADRVRASFARQEAMTTIGAELLTVQPGMVEIVLPYRKSLTQQHAYLHAGIITTIADTACGYAAFTLMEVADQVLTVEFKVNLLAPGRGDRFLARGRVVRFGRTLTVCTGDVFAQSGGEERLVATMLATMMAVHGHTEREID